MKFKYGLYLFLSAANFKQNMLSSQEQNKNEMYGKVAAMLQGETRLQIEAYKRYTNHPEFNIFEYIPPEQRIKKNPNGQLKILNSWITPYFTPEEARTLVNQAPIIHDQDKSNIYDFLTTGSWGKYSCLCSLGTGLTSATNDLRLSYRLHEFDCPIETVVQRNQKPSEWIRIKDWVLLTMDGQSELD